MHNKRGLYSFDSAVFGDTLDVNVVNSRFFMSNTQLQLIRELILLYEREKREQEILLAEKRDSYPVFLDELLTLYRTEKERLYNRYLKPFINEYPFLNKKSSLAILNKVQHENYHSCFLKEIWEDEPVALLDFLKLAGVSDNWLGTIRECHYHISIEYHTHTNRKRDLCNKRVDLIIEDNINQWVIVIENKVFSHVHADSKSGRDQLAIYADYCQHSFPDYKKQYILLSHCDNKSYALKNDWIYADYYIVMKSLLKYGVKNGIVRDYLQTLYSLLFNGKQFNTQIYNEETSLCQYYSFINSIISKIY